jgi:hypothetical protein
MIQRSLSSLVLLGLLLSGLANTPHLHSNKLTAPLNHQYLPHFHIGHPQKNLTPITEKVGGFTYTDDHEEDAIYIASETQVHRERKIELPKPKDELKSVLPPVIRGFSWDEIDSHTPTSVLETTQYHFRSKISTLLCCFRC